MGRRPSNDMTVLGDKRTNNFLYTLFNVEEEGLKALLTWWRVTLGPFLGSRKSPNLPWVPLILPVGPYDASRRKTF